MMALYAGRVRTRTTRIPVLWHLSYLPSGHRNRMTLCGKRGLAFEERIIFEPGDLAKLKDTTNKVCSICEKSTLVVA